MGAQSSRIVPPVGRSNPAIIRRSVDLPAPVGPMMTTMSAGLERKLTPARMGRRALATLCTTLLTSSIPNGGGSSVRRLLASTDDVTDEMVVHASCAEVKARHADSSASTGCSVRLMMIELAIMLPARSSFCSTSQAPVPMTATWSTSRTTRAMDAMAATRSLARTTGASASSFSRMNSTTAPLVHPIALTKFACLTMLSRTRLRPDRRA